MRETQMLFCALGWLIAGTTMLASPANAQHKAASGIATVGSAATANKADKAAVTEKATATRPLWRELTPKQQEALQPLAGEWDTLNPGHKRKWLALVRSNAEMSAADRATLRSRMSEWARLSNQQRAQARFNFAEVKQVPLDERKAKWESYQALTEAQRHELAERANTGTHGATVVARPVPLQKLAPLPSGANKNLHSPRIQLQPPPAASPAAMPQTPALSVASPATAPAGASAEVPAVAATMPAPSPPAAAPPAARVQTAPLIEAP
ncbi:DUF3106 domain-containing protein [Variovorax ginsengisoli]|uniref:DUF3106 domain-containing protein n=1 Tax=Variovorax ginsengisoli TaxID=363844 RepID=A0ABT9SFH6_9BURK|nr:DUF3106 domain-containing protein [Variovorax ginsengisoli]MDP9902117.1 hypothetical protein [Variovorax ginsengisoli]